MRTVWFATACLIVGSAMAMAQTSPIAITMKDATGTDVGTVTISQQGDAVQMQVALKGLPAGEHGIHVHAVGSCTPPDFTSAGGHLNPANKHHGFDNPDGHHAGDFPASFAVGADGTGTATLSTTALSLDPASASAVYGKAIVVHAMADDQKTDPAGASGKRIACGVIPSAPAQ